MKELEPTGYDMVLWIQHLLWPAVVSLPVYGDVLNRWFLDILHWCQDEPRYWELSLIHDENYVQRAIEIYDGPHGTRSRVIYTDPDQLPAALCQAIYRAVKANETTPPVSPP